MHSNQCLATHPKPRTWTKTLKIYKNLIPLASVKQPLSKIHRIPKSRVKVGAGQALGSQGQVSYYSINNQKMSLLVSKSSLRLNKNHLGRVWALKLKMCKIRKISRIQLSILVEIVASSRLINLLLGMVLRKVLEEGLKIHS